MSTETLAILWAVVTVVLMITVVSSGSYLLYQILIPKETKRKYSFETKKENGGAYVELTAPNGFVENEIAKISDSGELGNSDFGNMIPFLSIMRGNAGNEFINLLAVEDQEAEFELSKSMQVSIVLREANDDPTRSAPFEIQEVDVFRSRKPDLLLGAIALLALSFTIPSGMLALWEMLIQLQ